MKKLRYLMLAPLILLMASCGNTSEYEVESHATPSETIKIDEHDHEYVDAVVENKNVSICDICGEIKEIKEGSITFGVNAQSLDSFGLFHMEIPVKGKAPTCTEPGWYDYVYCPVCPYTTFRARPALGHNLINYIGMPATCESDGYESYDECTRCGYNTCKIIPALGHKLIIHDGKNPTCESDGYKAYATCERCSFTTFEKIDKLGHKLIHHEGKNPTCEEDGYEAYDSCERCDYTTYKKIDKLGHDIINHDGKNPTCEEDGYKSYDTCNRCEYSTYEKIDKLGHDIIHHDGKSPTCEEDGYNPYDTCNRCDYSTYEHLDKLGHNIVHVDRVEPTSTTPGMEEYDYCTRCDFETPHNPIPALHDYRIKEYVPSTCTEKGYIINECADCHDTYRIDLELAPHEFVIDTLNWKEGYTNFDRLVRTNESLGLNIVYENLYWYTIEPNSIVSAYALYKCKNCNAELRDPAEVTYTVTKEPTCDEDGIRSFYVTYKDIVVNYYVASYVYDALGHNYVDGVCTRCNKTKE